MSLSTIKLNIPNEAIRTNFINHLESLEVLFVVPNGGSAVVLQYSTMQSNVIYSEVKPELKIFTGHEATAELQAVTNEDLEMLMLKSYTLFEEVQ